MKNIMLVLVSNTASICCVLGAIELARTGKSGWGWFLFAAWGLTSNWEFTKKGIGNGNKNGLEGSDLSNVTSLPRDGRRDRDDL